MVLVCVCPGAGAAPPLPTEDDFLARVPVVLSATRLPQSAADSPAAVTVIDRELIEASGAREVHELLRLVPGFQVASESGSVHVATYHGLTDKFARRLQVMVDGRSVYSPAVGGVEWNGIPLAVDDIERIEVVRGANGATHGANAVQGVVNIVTRVPEDYGPLALRLRRGQGGVADALVQHGGGAGPLRYRVSAAYEADDGFENRFDTHHVRKASLRADLQLGPAGTLDLQAGWSGGPRQEGFADNPRFGETTTERLTRYQLLRWHHVGEAGRELTVQAYHNDSSRDGTRRGAAIRSAPDRARAERYDLEAWGLFRPHDAVRAVMGAGVRRDRVEGELFFGTGRTFRNDMRRVFGNLEWRAMPRLLVHAGALWEGSDLGGDNVAPRLAANYRLAPGHTLRAGVSRAHRNPLLFEARGSLRVALRGAPGTVEIFKGPGSLEPEWVLSQELGYVGELRDARLTLDLRLYRERLDGLIFAVPGPGGGPPWSWSNLDEAEVRGAEGQLEWRPDPRLRLLASYSYADVDSSRRELEESTPRHTASLFALYRMPRDVTVSGLLYLVDEQRWLSEGSLVSGYGRLDLRLAKGFRLGSSRGEVALVAQGLPHGHPDFLETDAGYNERDPRAFVTLELAL